LSISPKLLKLGIVSLSGCKYKNCFGVCKLKTNLILLIILNLWH